MAKDKNKVEFEHPEYEKLTTADEVDALIITHKERLVTKDFVERRCKQEKKDFNEGINELLKEAKEEREHEMGVIQALQDRRKQILNNVIPISKASKSP